MLRRKFTDSNDSAAKDAVSGDEKTVKKVLELLTLQKKMETAMTADVDTNVSDEEAAQKKMQYVLFSTKTTGSDGKSTDMSDDKKAEVKKKQKISRKMRLRQKIFLYLQQQRCISHRSDI